MKKIIIIMVLLGWVCGIAKADIIETIDSYNSAQKSNIVNMKYIEKIESQGNAKAYNKSSKAIGLYQITPICLKEYNNFHPKRKYSSKDLYNPCINYIVAEWYIRERIPQLLKYYKKPVTIENILISYNAGIGYVVKGKSLPKETIDYIKKYKKLQTGGKI